MVSAILRCVKACPREVSVVKRIIVHKHHYKSELSTVSVLYFDKTIEPARNNDGKHGEFKRLFQQNNLKAKQGTTINQ